MARDDDMPPGIAHDPKISRRGFGLASLAVGSAVAAPALAEDGIMEMDVNVPTPDGTCDAAFFHGKGAKPGVVMIPDVVGLRPAFRRMGRRLATAGYSVLVINPYYREKKAPVVSETFDFANQEDRAAVFALRSKLTNATIDTDTAAFVDWLAKNHHVSKAKMGFTGYCMGGAIVMRAAAIRPDRVGAGASWHGGGLTTDKPDSPHLLAPKIKAKMVFGVAQDDDAKQPESKTILKDAFDKTGNPAIVEVYKANHGWCVPGSAAYNEAEAERAWAELLKLYKGALV
ncbi:dienelactone hydrolase family protein [Caulobacter sp. SLTY]|uniref:dienelactone hydrolase family protein n=1 Tax=Caulobacter sp. SLTY TaxID=2683262 RepID=UPI001412B21E|nr:dienelactone hydrolase family protein [Caulobacter sp. SLTY]NBB16113.1 dienelactone hydrolase family protein [Caulobacter sp. SLTY]